MNESWDSEFYKYDCKPFLVRGALPLCNKLYLVQVGGVDYYYALPSYVSELDFFDWLDYIYGEFEFNVRKI